MKIDSLKVFIGYSHKDESLKDELESHLAPFRRKGVIASWHDRKILAGKDWDNEIDSNLESSDLILLLVSSDFIASEYCYGRELKKALEMHELGRAFLIPIIIRPVFWEETSFSHIQALPKDGEPVTRWQNRDDAWLNVSEGIQKAIEYIVSQKNRAQKTEGPKEIQEILHNQFELIESYIQGKADIGFTGLSTGFLSFDQMINGLQPADFIMIASRPSVSRTDFILNIASHLSAGMKIPVILFSMTLSSTKVASQLMVSNARISSHGFSRFRLGENDWVRLSMAVGRMAEATLYIDDSLKPSFSDIEQRASRAIQELECKVVIIDSLQHIADVEKGDKGKIEVLIRSLKELARKLDVTLIATSRLWNDPKFSAALPEMAELGDWESLEEHADVVGLITEDPEDFNPLSSDKRLVILRVLKNQNGHTGTIKLAYSKKYKIYMNLDHLMTDGLDEEDSTDQN